MMGTPSGVNLTEFRGIFLDLRGAGLGEWLAGRAGAARVGGASGAGGTGATGAAGAAGGGADLSTVGAAGAADRSVSRTIQGRNAHAASAIKSTKAAVTATAWLRRKEGPVGAAREAEAGVVRVSTTCQGSG
jgi:hypothetical protein